MSTSSSSSITNIGTRLTNSITFLLPTRLHFRNSSPASPLVTTAAVVAGTIGSLAFARWAWTDYQAYLGYGPGGLPYNVFGWLITTTNLITSFNSIVTKNPHLIQLKPSQYERRHEAIWVADSVDASKTPAPFGNNKNKYPLEISHVHPNADCSVHVVLAPRDAARVIRAGWGQLHGLAGSKVIPRSYVFLYAPRTQEELNVIMDLVRAGVGYMTGTELGDVQPA
ncbi:hypothetical protein KCU88_g6968, partial [Aureobasidium melanogenum]